MNLGIIRKIIAFSVFTMIAVVGLNIETNAQDYRRYDRERREEIREERRERREDRREARRERREDRREWREDRREDIRDARRDYRRYRVYRNGRYYNTDYRGAELLRAAVNRGYQQGYRAGQVDASRRYNYRYNDSQYYRSGTYGYQSYVDRNMYQYYFREGFQRGYEDGYYSRSRYGYNSGGGWNILGSILSGILNIQQY